MRFILTLSLLLGCFVLTLAGCDKSSSTHKTKAPASPVERPINAEKKYSYLYGLSGYRYADLIKEYSAKVMVVDVDDAGLNADQVNKLRASGTIIFSYLSIGEAENYRPYWKGWEKNKPSFLLEENKDWQGNFRVKFWDKNWQNIIINKAVEIARMGFDGVYLDIIDGYQQESVIRAYPGNKKQLRQEMENFVIRISNHTKKINPRFKIIPQNAVELLALEENKKQGNLNYLRAIDGLGVEDLWYDDNSEADWTPWDLQLIRLAQTQGKFVLATSYPTDPKKQAEFLNNALKAKFIPFAGKRSLSKKEGVYKVNQQLPKAMSASYFQLLH